MILGVRRDGVVCDEGVNCDACAESKDMEIERDWKGIEYAETARRVATCIALEWVLSATSS